MVKSLSLEDKRTTSLAAIVGATMTWTQTFSPKYLGLVLSALLAAWSNTALAEEPELLPPDKPAFEVNLLWPIFPGGITDLKLMWPILNGKQEDFRGELVTGIHSDFGWRFVRKDDAGKVAFLGAKLGYKQFFVYGLHAEAVVNFGWRHEENNPWDGDPIDSFQGRLWTFVGYQHQLSKQAYLNARYGFGLHLFRTDRHADKERIVVPASGDLNLGFYF